MSQHQDNGGVPESIPPDFSGMEDDHTALFDAVRVARETRDNQSFTTRVLSGNNMGRGRFFRVAWYRDTLPLPIINYLLIWQTYGPRNFGETVKRVSRAVLTFALKMIRIVFFLGHAYYWLNAIQRDGSMATYSDAYFGDILGYVFRNYPLLADRHCEITRDRKNLLALEYKNWRQFLYDLVAYNIRAMPVVNLDTMETERCVPSTDSLIHKFSWAVTRSGVLSRLPSEFVTIFTVCIYLVYGLGALLLKINMAIMFGLKYFQRLLPGGRFFGNLIKSLWYQGSPALF